MIKQTGSHSAKKSSRGVYERKAGSYVVFRDAKGGWNIQSEGTARTSEVFSTQREAVARAREISRSTGTELVIQDRSGRVRRIETPAPKQVSKIDAKSERIELRTTSETKALLQRAASATHKNVTEFLLEAGLDAAEDALADRRIFRLNDEKWKAFQEALDRPVSKKPRLARLLTVKSLLE